MSGEREGWTLQWTLWEDPRGTAETTTQGINILFISFFVYTYFQYVIFLSKGDILAGPKVKPVHY